MWALMANLNITSTVPDTSMKSSRIIAVVVQLGDKKVALLGARVHS
jgi:hypothetical protein